MSWKRFRILAVVANVAVFAPLWFIWISEGVVAELGALLPRAFISALMVCALTCLLLSAVHLTLFGLAKWRGELPKNDGVAKLVATIAAALVTIAVISYALLISGAADEFPLLQTVFGASTILGVIMLCGAVLAALPEILAFRSIKHAD